MKPYLPDRDRFFDEDEWDRFMNLSETEAEAEVTAADRETIRARAEVSVRCSPALVA